MSVGDCRRVRRRLVNQQRSDGDGGGVVSRGELLRQFAALPGTFPHTKRYAAELTAGIGYDRFDFTIGLLINGLADRQATSRRRTSR